MRSTSSHRPTLAAIAIAGIAAIASTARGEPEPEREGRPETIVITPRPRGVGDLVGDERSHADAGRGLTSPAFVTVISIDDRAGETTSIAEVLARTVGVRVRSLGGLGGFSSASVRGGAPGQTAVLVDGVPLSRLGSASVDLGRFELESFSSMELYRGGVPAGFGGASMAGALNLVTQVGPVADERFRLSVGAGSFGARHLRGRWLDGSVDRRHAIHVSAGYAGADGDYVYFDDRGTNLNLDDDELVHRSNNGYDQVDSTVRYRYDDDDIVAGGGARSQWKQQGVPGASNVQTRTATLTTFTQLADASVARRHLLGAPALTGKLSVHAMIEHQRYRDRDGEIGFAAQDRRYLTAAVGVIGQLIYARGRHRAETAVELRGDRFSDRDLTGMAELPRSQGGRVAAGASIADEIAAGRWLVEPAVRVDVMRTDPVSDIAGGATGLMDLPARTDVLPSPRVSARWLATDWLSLKANAGWYFRPPTALELFGDRGFILGNPSLRPERGISADAGVVAASERAHGAIDRIYTEAALFGSRPTDVIVLLPNAGPVAGARNLGGAWIGGAELTASARAARTVTATAHYTWLESWQTDTIASYEGNRLPQHPRHQLAGRIDVAHRIAGRLAAVWGDATIMSGNFLDPGNVEQVPGRRFFGAGIKLELGAGLFAGVEGKNLTDVRVEQIELDPAPRPDLSRVPRAVADFFGYPLPGRAFYLTIDLEI